LKNARLLIPDAPVIIHPMSDLLAFRWRTPGRLFTDLYRVPLLETTYAPVTVEWEVGLWRLEPILARWTLMGMKLMTTSG
jgi:hypothetical protein